MLFIVLMIWLFAVSKLSTRYEKRLHEYEEKKHQSTDQANAQEAEIAPIADAKKEKAAQTV